MKKLRKSLLIILASLTLLLSAGYLYISQNSYYPTDRALAFSKKAKETKGQLYFKRDGKTKATVIFYQGALVEAASYAEMAELLSQKGYDVYLLDTPLNLPILSTQKALDLLPQLADKPVYLAGHSMGGVVAAMNAEETVEFDGLILLASYPSKKTDLSKEPISVLSITAENDKVLNWNNYEEAKKRLPATTSYQSISGGNHGGFGDYGHQKNDGKATISSSEQIKQATDDIDDFIQAQ